MKYTTYDLQYKWFGRWFTLKNDLSSYNECIKHIISINKDKSLRKFYKDKKTRVAKKVIEYIPLKNG